MGKILAISLDEMLLRTRSEVLLDTGANVIERLGTDLSDLREQQFDLVVLCYSIPDRQRKHVADEVRRLWPQVRIIQVSDMALPLTIVPKYADALTSWGEPQELVAIAVELLRDKRNGKGFSPNSSSVA